MRTLAVALILATAGCSALQRDRPEQPPESAQVRSEVNIGVGYLLLGQVRGMVADATRSGLINKSEATRFLELTDDARRTLDTASQLHFSGVEGAAVKGMNAMDLILSQVKRELEEKIKAKKGGK